MKIIVYNHYDQYALARAEVELIKAAMPKGVWAGISEFHLLDDKRNVEVLEYNKELKTALFSFPVKEKTPLTTERAIRELLIGLARIRSGSKFYLPLKAIERESYSEFVDNWLPVCMKAIGRTPTS